MNDKTQNDQLPEDWKKQRYTLAEAAEYLGISTRTLYQFRARGVHIPYIRVGYKIFYLKDDLDEWLEKNVKYHKDK